MSSLPRANPWWAATPAVLGVALASGFALRPELAESYWMWTSLCVSYLLLGAWAMKTLAGQGKLREFLRFKSGDVSLGILLGLLMVGAGWLALRIAFPLGSSGQAWLFGLYAQVGNLNQIPIICALALLAFLEEIVWRGWVANSFTERFGARISLPATATLYALAHVPTVFTLADDRVGPNPLLVLAALGAGLCWGFAARGFGRLAPVVVAHIVFSYFMASPPPAWLP